MNYYLTQAGRELLSEFSLGGDSQHSKQQHDKFMLGRRLNHEKEVIRMEKGVTDPDEIRGMPPKPPAGLGKVRGPSVKLPRKPADRTSPEYKDWMERYGHHDVKGK